MQVIVETLGNEIISDYCFKAYIGAVNDGHDVVKMSLPNVSTQQDKLRNERPMPIGSVGYMEYFFSLYGVDKPMPLHVPEYMQYFTDREFDVVEARGDLQYPIFVKPLLDVKKFTGFVAKSKKAWDLYPELEGWDGPYLCSKPFDKEILSEWRCFIELGKIVNISIYLGNALYTPKTSELKKLQEKAIAVKYEMPCAYTVDIAITTNANGKCQEVVELNDMWAIGPYGCDDDTYFRLLKRRWNQIVK